MTLAEDFSESVWGDGTPDERRGADPARRAEGLGSATADDDGSGAASWDRAASGRMSKAPPRSITARSEADAVCTWHRTPPTESPRSTATTRHAAAPISLGRRTRL